MCIDGEPSKESERDLRTPVIQGLRKFGRDDLRAHKLALVERSLTLGRAVGSKGVAADHGRGISGGIDEDVETVLEMLDAERVKEAADRVFRC